MTNSLKKILGQIEDFLLNDESKKALWDILTALRGPDRENNDGTLLLSFRRLGR